MATTDVTDTNGFAGEASKASGSETVMHVPAYPVTQALLAVAEELRLTRAVLERLVTAVEMLEGR